MNSTICISALLIVISVLLFLLIYMNGKLTESYRKLSLSEIDVIRIKGLLDSKSQDLTYAQIKLDDKSRHLEMLEYNLSYTCERLDNALVDIEVLKTERSRLTKILNETRNN